MFPLRKALVTIAVVLASLAGGLLALATFQLDRELSVGTIRLAVDPGHAGALDLYVPVVDWGARFPALRGPARLKVEVRAVDRGAVARLAAGGRVDVRAVRREARGAVAAYLRALIAMVFAAALAAGAMAALAARSWPAGAAAAAGAVLAAGATAYATIPHGPIDRPEYYASGPDIPRALRILEDARRSGRALDQELDAQLVGLARLVSDPSNRPAIDRAPRLTVTSDLHNNVISIDILERAARGGPVLFAGDLTDRGSALEARATRHIVRTGRPFVFVTGNHDSDALARRLARDGAVVLTEAGRLLPGGRLGPVAVRVAGVRVAGYSDPFERRRSQNYADRYDSDGPTFEQQAAFADWLEGLRGRVDVVMLHDERLADIALRRLDALPPEDPLVLVVGHTHRPELQRQPNVLIVNGGSIGAGGTGNLTERGEKIGLAVLAFARRGGFEPLAVDLVEIDPGTGSSTARREVLTGG